ncbi:CBASS cGAMP-activated phospholipase [Candidatus Leptofilum sp.]|uniref:CBASS cGAMP-activated phospholipase n=1 Tax=Candidatus Leptofilum sp. TaxID=3241576 RepID=UPI003B591343
MNKQTRILTIDGGGIRGLIPARILVSLERKLQQRTGRNDAYLAEYFDLIAGTSTGGLITCLLLAPGENEWTPAFTAQEIVDLYLNHGTEIFDAPLSKRIRSLNGLVDERYQATGFERLIDERVGDLWLSQLIKPCLITAYDVTRRKAKFFTQHDARNDDKDYPIKVVARATSAAPTYFEAMPGENGRTPYAYVDGGLFANNPTMCAYVEAYRKLADQPTAENMVILSLGTGQISRSYPYHNVKDWGMVQWIKPLIDIMMAGMSETVDYQMRQLFTAHGRSNSYLRLQATIAKDDTELAEMDNVTPANMERLLALGVQLADEHEAELDALVEELLSVEEPTPA